MQIQVINVLTEISVVSKVKSQAIPCHLPDGPQQSVREPQDVRDITNQSLFEQCNNRRLAFHPAMCEELMPDRPIDTIELVVMRLEACFKRLKGPR
jgi:hypothetical protein